MIGKVAQAIIGAHKVNQARKTVKSGVQRIDRQLSKQPTTKKSSGPLFKNIRTPSNTPGGMKGWQNAGQPKKTTPKKIKPVGNPKPAKPVKPSAPKKPKK